VDLREGFFDLGMEAWQLGRRSFGLEDEMNERKIYMI
jgi:hypothetical protein